MALVRRSYAALLRAARSSFAGDVPALTASRAEARRVFRANAGERDAERLRKLIADAHDAAAFLEESVVQARLNTTSGVYEMAAKPQRDAPAPPGTTPAPPPAAGGCRTTCGCGPGGS